MQKKVKLSVRNKKNIYSKRLFATFQHKYDTPYIT